MRGSTTASAAQPSQEERLASTSAGPSEAEDLEVSSPAVRQYQVGHDNNRDDPDDSLVLNVSGRAQPKNHSSGSNKRVRSRPACAECRRGKTRCDGALPQCGRCRDAGIECVPTIDQRKKRSRMATTAPENQGSGDGERSALIGTAQVNRIADTAVPTSENLLRFMQDQQNPFDHLSVSSTTMPSAAQHFQGFNQASNQTQSVTTVPDTINIDALTYANTSMSNVPPKFSTDYAVPRPLLGHARNSDAFFPADGSSLSSQNDFTSTQSSLLSQISSVPNFTGNSASSNRSPAQSSSTTVQTSNNAHSHPISPPPVLNGVTFTDRNPAEGNSSRYLDQNAAQALASLSIGTVTPGGLNQGSLEQQFTQVNGRMTVSDGGRLRWYGATSSRNLSFGGLHFQPLHQRLANQGKTLNDRCLTALSRLTSESSLLEGNFGVESKVVSLYFRWSNPFFYALAEEPFCQQWQKYREALEGISWKPLGAEDCPNFSLTLLYAILAAAAPMSDEVIAITQCQEAPEMSGDYWMAKARTCLDVELDSPQETTVQALMIMAGREATVGRDARGYAYIGMALSCALDLGLHTDVTAWLEEGRISKDQYHFRVVTWWGVFTYEKLWALYVGRPSLCRDGQVSVALPDSMQNASTNPDHLRHYGQHSDFLRALIGLLRITDCIINELYNATSTRSSKLKLIEWSNEQNDNLTSWYEGLPDDLKLDPESDKMPSSPHVVILHLQYYITLISLQRPFTCDGRNRVMFESKAFRTCASAACSASNLIEMYGKAFTLRRVSVVAVHQFFTAASMHVFIIHACSSLASGQATQQVLSASKKGLLACLAGLAALSATQVHARRSYLLIALLMKRWNITVNTPEQDASRTSARAGVSFAQPSEALDTLSKELFSLLSKSSSGTVVVGPPHITRAAADKDMRTGDATHDETHQVLPFPESGWTEDLFDFNSAAADGVNAADELATFFAMGYGSPDNASAMKLQSYATSGSWDRPALADIFDLSFLGQTSITT